MWQSCQTLAAVRSGRRARLPRLQELDVLVQVQVRTAERTEHVAFFAFTRCCNHTVSAPQLDRLERGNERPANPISVVVVGLKSADFSIEPGKRGAC